MTTTKELSTKIGVSQQSITYTIRRLFPLKKPEQYRGYVINEEEEEKIIDSYSNKRICKKRENPCFCILPPIQEIANTMDSDHFNESVNRGYRKLASAIIRSYKVCDDYPKTEVEKAWKEDLEMLVYGGNKRESSVFNSIAGISQFH